jgi:hypothetical protein
MQKTTLEKLSQALSQIDRPGSFCVSGSVPAVLPGLEVEGLGPIGLPLTAKTAKELKKQAHQAPYGKGEKTLVDTDPRSQAEPEFPDRTKRQTLYPGLYEDHGVVPGEDEGVSSESETARGDPIHRGRPAGVSGCRQALFSQFALPRFGPICYQSARLGLPASRSALHVRLRPGRVIGRRLVALSRGGVENPTVLTRVVSTGAVPKEGIDPWAGDSY